MAVEEEDDVVVRMINSAVVLRSDTLDLSKKRISELPQEILNLKDLESLHLEGNYIKELPDDFFDKLTNLKWLDLRNNRLESLPTSVGKHRCLRSLLLENNSLTHLPCELGFVNALCGLHLSGNPLEFPPSQIVEKGTQEVLQYLREMCNNNSQEWPEERLSRASDEESEDLRMSGRRRRLMKNYTTDRDFPEPVNAPATFHRPPKRVDQLRYEYDKLRISSSDGRPKLKALPRRRASFGDSTEVARKAAASAGVEVKRKTKKTLLGPYKPSSDTALKEAKRDKERKLRRTASLNQEENVLRQRIKNKLAIDDWREESRSLQQKKHYEALKKGVIKVKIPTPFATEGSENSEQDLKRMQKSINQYNKRLHSLLEMNDKDLTKKALNDRELENRIKAHVKKIREHKTADFENVTNEVEEARSNLELARKLHEELEQRRAMEYRLRAFTGDDFVLNPKYYRNKR